MAWEPGQSGNPEGRRKGTPNRNTLAVRERIAKEADPIGFLRNVMEGRAVERWAGTDEERQTVVPTLEQSIRAAIKLADKLTPDAKDNPLRFEVGKVEGPGDAMALMGRVLAAMGQGEITPSEASAVMGVVGVYLKAYEVEEIERRLAALEQDKSA